MLTTLETLACGGSGVGVFVGLGVGVLVGVAVGVLVGVAVGVAAGLLGRGVEEVASATSADVGVTNIVFSTVMTMGVGVALE